jgi:hypothetical protein
VPWARLLFPRERVNVAGRTLISDGLDEDAADIIGNWRAVHAYPLTAIQSAVRYWAPRCSRDKALISQRIKRMPAIKLKLSLMPHLNLTQMQDIGGCRAVVRRPYEVYKIVVCLKESRMKHRLIKENDYIANPKESGYRSYHLVYRFYSDNKNFSQYNGLKIEVQVRSTAQHAWATAVETVSTFNLEPLKSSIGSEDWLYFFKLMSSDMARRERRAQVPGTPTTRTALREEIIRYEKHLSVVLHLQGWRLSLQRHPNLEEAYYFLVQTFPIEGRVTIHGFSKDQLADANTLYLEAEERALAGKERSDSVLVSADNLRSLRRAYPNYFSDTDLFIAAIERAKA